MKLGEQCNMCEARAYELPAELHLIVSVTESAEQRFKADSESSEDHQHFYDTIVTTSTSFDGNFCITSKFILHKVWVH